MTFELACTTPGWCEEYQYHLDERLIALAREPGEKGDKLRRRLTERAAAARNPELKKPVGRTCVHRGERLELIECPSCRGNVKLVVSACALHEKCTDLTKLPHVRGCDKCPDRRLPPLQIASSMPVRDLIDVLDGPRDGWPADWWKWDVTTRAHSFAFRTLLADLKANAPPLNGVGRGIVICAGGWRFLASLVVTASVIRRVGCTLPIEAWHLGDNGEYDPAFGELTAGLGIEWVNANDVARRLGLKPRTLNSSGWVLKPFAVLHSRFREVISLDADSYPVYDPSKLFEHARYKDRGAIFWPDIGHGLGAPLQPGQWTRWGLPDRREPDFESGQLVVDKGRAMAALHATWWLNDHSDYVYRHYYGDKSTWHLGWRGTGTDYVMAPPARWHQVAFVQHDPDGAAAFIHRCRDKFRLPGDHHYCTRQNHHENIRAAGLPHEEFCHERLAELRAKVAELESRPRPPEPPPPITPEPAPERPKLPPFVPPAGWSPEVSIVMPVYNGLPHLVQALDSILGQTFRDFELICVDDGSLDETPAVLLDYATRDPRVRCFRKPNGGTGSALNLGFKHARGRYQTWWSADSWVTPDWLDKLRAALEANPQAVMAYSDWRRYEHDTGAYHQERTLEHDIERLRRECYVGCCWLWRGEAKARAGEFALPLCEDYDMHLRLAEIGPFVRVPESLGVWRQHSANLTATKSEPARWRHSDQVRARLRWRKADVRVVHVCPDLDPAGAVWRLWRGLTDWSSAVASRQIIGTTSPLGIGHDLHVSDTGCSLDELTAIRDEAQQALDQADVIHCHQALPDDPRLPLDIMAAVKRGARLIQHFHGGPWQWETDKIERLRARYGATILTCTPYLPGRVPGARWMPNYLPITPGDICADAWLYRPEGEHREGPVRFCCHHNYPAGKGAMQVKEILTELRQRGEVIDFEVEWTPKRAMREHLQHKRQFDVCIETITQGFIGLAGWEALAQGLVVLAYVDEDAAREYARLGDGEPPPIVNCRRPDDLAATVRRLARDRGEVARIGRASREWMLRHYQATKIVGLYELLYREGKR